MPAMGCRLGTTGTAFLHVPLPRMRARMRSTITGALLRPGHHLVTHEGSDCIEDLTTTLAGPLFEVVQRMRGTAISRDANVCARRQRRGGAACMAFPSSHQRTASSMPAAHLQTRHGCSLSEVPPVPLINPTGMATRLLMAHRYTPRMRLPHALAGSTATR